MTARKLREEEISRLNDIRHTENRALTWEEQRHRNLPGTTRRAYEKVCNNINFRMPITWGEERQATAFLTTVNGSKDNVWKIECSVTKQKEIWRAQHREFEVKETFKATPLGLVKIGLSVPPEEEDLKRVLVGNFMTPTNSKVKYKVVGDTLGQFGMAASYSWANGKEIHMANTAQRRKLLQKDMGHTHCNIQKWNSQMSGTLDLDQTWKTIWNSNRATKHNGLMWQITYRALATNCWRHPEARRSNPCTWCDRCGTGEAETIRHLFWECNESAPIWAWVNDCIQHVSGKRNREIQITWQQALLGTPLPERWNCPSKLWDLLRGAALWAIWSARCSHSIAKKKTSFYGVRAIIWGLMRTYLKLEWEKNVKKVKEARITKREAINRFHLDFGRDLQLYVLNGSTIIMGTAVPWDVH